eukprot:362858-Chlamydomonas_euryale.AAC.3
MGTVTCTGNVLASALARPSCSYRDLAAIVTPPMHTGNRDVRAMRICAMHNANLHHLHSE